jgi:threonine dehydrogenase-like Zn-dependent dehydrogenase
MTTTMPAAGARPAPAKNLSLMKAFVMKKVNETGFVEKPIPTAGPNDAIVRTTRALVCTSDTHTLSGAIGDRENLTLGHEAVGRVHALGSEVRGLAVGDRVAVNAITPCYRCANCQRGFTSQCTQMLGGWRFSNVKDGVFAEYFHVNDAEANLAPIPDDLSDDLAVYTCDMMSTGFMGAEHAAIPLGGSVAVFGVGPVGMMAVQGARLLGAGQIIAVEHMPKRKELAHRFGADLVVDFREVDPVAEILRLTGGAGVDSAIEALGAQETFEAAVKATRPGGTVSVIGYFGRGDFVNIPRLEWGVGMSDKTIRTGLCPGGRERMTRLMGLLRRGRVDPSPMTTHRFHFSELDRAVHMMKTKEDGIVKPLILFD